MPFVQRKGKRRRKIAKIEFNRNGLIERYEGIDGQTIREIALDVKKSRTFVRNRLIEHRIERRLSGRRPFRREGLRWATHWKKCRQCGGTDRVHQGHGLCSMHYRRWHRQGKPPLDD